MTVLFHPESGEYFARESRLLSGPDFDECVEVDPCQLRAGTVIKTGLGVSVVLPSLDVETYSAAGFIIDGHTGKVTGTAASGKGGLGVVGTPNYVEHGSAEILSMVYDLKDGLGRRRWVQGMPDPVDLLNHIANGGLLEAFNVTFEWWVWNMIGHRKMGWPMLQIGQTRCAMAKARRFSLPGSLDGAAKVMGTPQKDPAGGALITKLTRPHTPTSKRKAVRWTQATAWDDFVRLYNYNDQDVVAEDNLSAHVPDLTEYERRTWLLDQTVNARGLQVDVQTLDAALSILGQVERKYTQELARITGGAIGSVSEVAKILSWLAGRGVHLPSLDAEDVEGGTVKLRASNSDPVALRVLEIREELGSANVKKLRTLKLQVSSDGRLRDQYMYCGADRTGRFSAGGVQLQNITARGPHTGKCEDGNCGRYYGIAANPWGCPRCQAPDWAQTALEAGEWPIDAVEQAIEDVRTCSLEHVERVWGSVTTVLCGILRGLFIAGQGAKLVCADFSAIEAVVAACLSRCQWRIDVFNTPGECIYTQSASKITGTPMAEYKAYKAKHKRHHPDRKLLGKIAELASGYGGWVGAWKNFGCELDDKEIKRQVLAWRAASPEIVDMWGGEYKWVGPGQWDFKYELHGLEGCAMKAIMRPGQCFTHNDITYGVHDDILYCRLPSGRFLHYHRPRLKAIEDKLRRGPAQQITFEGYNSDTKKGPKGWLLQETYGGRLFENVVQAVALDIQAEALVRCGSRGYPIVLHTHDEGCAEVPDSPAHNVATLVGIMTERPSWASWWPIRAAGWEHQRYQKD